MRTPIFIGYSGGFGENNTTRGSIVFAAASGQSGKAMNAISCFSVAHAKSDIWMFSVESFFGSKYGLLGVGTGVAWNDDSEPTPFISFGGIARYEFIGLKVMRQPISGWSGEILVTFPFGL